MADTLSNRANRGGALRCPLLASKEGKTGLDFMDYIRETGIVAVETTFLDFVAKMGEPDLDYKI